MTILVCPMSRVESVLARRTPERVISLLDPDFPSPYTGPAYAGRHLRLDFHDVEVATWEENPPSAQDIRKLLDFVDGWKRDAPLLIHCRAGVSRSPAAAFVAACALNPDASEAEIALTLRAVAPFARPNAALVRLADVELSRQGRMCLALDALRAVEARRASGEAALFELPSTFGR